MSVVDRPLINRVKATTIIYIVHIDIGVDSNYVRICIESVAQIGVGVN